MELGEETWKSDFGHYETMIPCNPCRVGEGKEEKKPKEKTQDLYWCKNYK